MTPRALTQLVLLHLFLALATLLALAAVMVRGLLTEVADEVSASRNERRTVNRHRGNMSLPKNRKVRDFDSTTLLRAMNAALAAQHGDDSRIRAELAQAEFYAGNAAMPIRRSL